MVMVGRKMAARAEGPQPKACVDESKRDRTCKRVYKQRELRPGVSGDDGVALMYPYTNQRAAILASVLEADDSQGGRRDKAHPLETCPRFQKRTHSHVFPSRVVSLWANDGSAQMARKS